MRPNVRVAKNDLPPEEVETQVSEYDPNHDAIAADFGPMDEAVPIKYRVHSVTYRDWEKRGNPDAPHTLCVTYLDALHQRICSQWLCPNHTGMARGKFETWWVQRSYLPIPEDLEEALDQIASVGIREPSEITVDESKQFPEIVQFNLKPFEAKPYYDPEDIPF